MESAVRYTTFAALVVMTTAIAACKSTAPAAPAPAEAPQPAASAEPVPPPAPPAAAAPTAAMTASVSGNVTYRVRKALPPDALITVQLIDAGSGNEPVKVLGEQTIEARGRQVPFAYKVAYDPKAIAAKNRYQVSAQISVGGDLWFATETPPRVITGGNPKRRDIVLIPANKPAR
jgi:putative lipoprotein